MNGFTNIEHYVAQCQKGFPVTKHSSLLDPLVADEGNEVLRTQA
jgi:hypothetical protein